MVRLLSVRHVRTFFFASCMFVQGWEPVFSQTGAPSRMDQYGDPLPKHCLSRLGTVRFWKSNLRSMVVSPTELFAATLSYSFQLRPRRRFFGSDSLCVWQLETGKVLFERKDLRSGFRVVYSPDGRTLYCPDGAKVLAIDAHTGKTQREFKSETAGALAARYDWIGVSRDGKLLAACGVSGDIHLWNTKGGSSIRRWRVKRGVRGIWFSATGELVSVSGRKESVVSIWDPDSGRLVSEIVEQVQPQGLDLSPDGKIVALFTKTGEIVLLDSKNGARVRSLSQAGVSTATFVDGGRLLFAGTDEGIRVWDTEKGEEIRSFTCRDKCRLLSLGVAANRKWLIAARTDGAICRLDIASGKELGEEASQLIFAWPFSFVGRTYDLVRTGRRILPEGKAQTELIVYNAISAKPIRKLIAPDVPVRDPFKIVSIVAHEKQALTLNIAGELFLWDLEGKVPKKLTRVAGEKYMMGELLAAGEILALSNAGQVRLWNSIPGQALGPPLQLAQAICGRLSSDGKRAVVGYKKYTQGKAETSLGVVDISSGRLLWETKDVHVEQLAISADGKGVACLERQYGRSSRKEKVSLWDISTGKRRGEIERPYLSVKSLCLSQKGEVLGVGGTDGSITLCEAGREKTARTISGHNGAVMALSFSADGKLLASGALENTVLIWAVKDVLTMR